ncbi:S-type pyocin domain-containing protein [Sodalis sp. RH15]|uniref:S-type pyocin domain-containing protein n=1 Tax=Sodalis sp. RH15 TaxID=3394330 RepID=UPI0039B3FE6C
MPIKPIHSTGKTTYQGNGRSITQTPYGPISHLTGASNAGLGGPSPRAVGKLNTSLSNLNNNLQQSNQKIRDQITDLQKKQAEQQKKRNEETNRRMEQARAEQQKKLADMKAKTQADVQEANARMRAEEAARQQENMQRQAQEEARLREQEEAKNREAEQQKLAQEAAAAREREEAQRKADEAAEAKRRANEAIEAQRKADDAAKVAKELIAARQLNQENIQTYETLPSPSQAAVMAAAAGLASTAPAAEGLLARITAALAELGAIASSSKAGPHAAIIIAGLYPKEAGVGSDNVSGEKHFVKTLPAAMLNMPSEERLRLAALEHNTIDVPIRGRLVLTNSQIAIELIRTEQPTPVRVVTGIPDGKGNYQCTLPGTDALPASTILVTPAKAPGSTGLGAIITPEIGPKPVIHTGNNAQPIALPTVTTLPGFDGDLIVVPPLETADKPIYVMLSGRKESYRPNQGAVGNMGEFFTQQGFGSQVKEFSVKTNQQYQGQNIYKANKDIGSHIADGDIFYLDGAHKNHLELFDSNRKIKLVLNLDGSINTRKTFEAQKEGRRLPK